MSKTELKPCPQCGEIPEIGYCCGEYFIFHPSKVVGMCFCAFKSTFPLPVADLHKACSVCKWFPPKYSTDYKEIVQHLVNLLEIRYEDVPALHSGKYTVILRAVRPSISQVVPDDFMKTAQGGSIIDDLLHKPEPLIEWFAADNEIFYGGIRDGGRKFYETHVLGKFESKGGE